MLLDTTEAKEIFKLVQDRRRRAQYIGHEEDGRFLRHWRYANFRGPSDR